MEEMHWKNVDDQLEDAAWSDMKVALDHEMPQRLVWIWWAVIILILLGAGYLFFMKYTDSVAPSKSNLKEIFVQNNFKIKEDKKSISLSESKHDLSKQPAILMQQPTTVKQVVKGDQHNVIRNNYGKNKNELFSDIPQSKARAITKHITQNSVIPSVPEIRDAILILPIEMPTSFHLLSSASNGPISLSKSIPELKYSKYNFRSIFEQCTYFFGLQTGLTIQSGSLGLGVEMGLSYRLSKRWRIYLQSTYYSTRYKKIPILDFASLYDSNSQNLNKSNTIENLIINTLDVNMGLSYKIYNRWILGMSTGLNYSMLRNKKTNNALWELQYNGKNRKEENSGSTAVGNAATLYLFNPILDFYMQYRMTTSFSCSVGITQYAKPQMAISEIGNIRIANGNVYTSRVYLAAKYHF